MTQLMRKQNNEKTALQPFDLAEREGFEPSIRGYRIPDFESGAFDHSATFPNFVQVEFVIIAGIPIIS